MTVAIASVNSAVERLLVVAGHRPGAVHRLVGDATLAGGKGVNVARVLATLRAGGPYDVLGSARTHAAPGPLLFGFRGGATGRLFAELLAAEALPAALVETAGATRVNEVLVDRSDPAGATVYNAVGDPVTAAELALLDEAFESALDGAEALVCTGSTQPGVPEDQYARWIVRARERGVPSVLDAHGPALRAGAAAGPDVVKVNAEELAGLAGPPPGPDPHTVARGWLAAGSRCVIITDGATPAVALTREARYEVVPPAVAARSGVGSGDAFLAGLVHSMLGAPGGGWERHLRAAAACGASNAAGERAGLSPDAPPAALLARVEVRS
ncbi:1-phosphofructokinase family hexose kinase [Streptomyces sp. NPDC050560]|uniref:1-phosphofructokinase family hexose kinase n=1 Tax=Streptomyces sp. NPDC050560 TaxID=3365630 RepID=UPI0037B02C8D